MSGGYRLHGGVARPLAHRNGLWRLSGGVSSNGLDDALRIMRRSVPRAERQPGVKDP